MTATSSTWRTPAVVLLASGVILCLAMGIRHGFGLFLQPVTAQMGWGRETFALALAMQNLVWGATQPFVGLVADRFGSAKVIVAGGILYALGLVAMSYATTPWLFVLTGGVLIGSALSGVTYSVVAGVLGRRYPPEKRSMALGISAAAGSFGQFAMLPLTQWLLTHLGWHVALLTLGMVALAIVPVAAAMVERRESVAHAFQQSAPQAIGEAFRHRGYVLLTLGFFVCGFQVVFVGVHLPSYLADRGMAPEVATTALALIGLFNVFGTYAAGVLGQRLQQRHSLPASYAVRSVARVAWLAGRWTQR